MTEPTAGLCLLISQRSDCAPCREVAGHCLPHAFPRWEEIYRELDALKRERDALRAEVTKLRLKIERIGARRKRRYETIVKPQRERWRQIKALLVQREQEIGGLRAKVARLRDENNALFDDADMDRIMKERDKLRKALWASDGLVESARVLAIHGHHIASEKAFTEGLADIRVALASSGKTGGET